MAKLDDGFTKRGDVYWIRKTIPAALRAAMGKREIVKSLRTGDQKEAMRLFKIESLKIEAQLEAARQKVAAEAPAQDDLSEPPTPQYMTVDALRREIIESDYRNRVRLFKAAEGDPKAFYAGDLIAIPDTDLTARYRQDRDWEGLLAYCIRYQHKLAFVDVKRAVTRGDIEDMMKVAGDDILHASNLLLAKRDLLEELCKEGVDPQMIEVSAPAVAIASPVPLPNPGQAKTSGGGDIFSEVAERWYADKMRTKAWTENTREDHEAALRHFVEVVGNRPIGSYTKEDGRTFKGILIRLPANFHKKAPFRNLGSLAEVAKKADTMPSVPKMSTATVNKHMRKVSAFFTHAISSYDECHLNPVQGLTDRMKVSKRAQRDPFRIEQLKTLFNAPVYRGCMSPARWHDAGNYSLRDDAKFWVPLIGLFTGARLGEIVQLHVADVKEDFGVHYFDLKPTAEDDKFPKRLKNESSKRIVPIHPALIEMGFLDFVKTRRGRRTVRLFPEVIKEGTSMISDTMSKIFSRMLTKLKLKTKKDVFHSFRHTFKDACRNNGVPEEKSKALMGHEQEGESARCGDGFYLKTLAAEMAKVDYPGLDLSHLYRRES